MFGLKIKRDTGQSVQVEYPGGTCIVHRDGTMLSAKDYGRELDYWLSVWDRRQRNHFRFLQDELVREYGPRLEPV